MCAASIPIPEERGATAPQSDVVAIPLDPLTPLAPGAARRLEAQHRRLAATFPSALDALMGNLARRLTVGERSLRPWLDLLVRAYTACGGQEDGAVAQRSLETVLAAFAAAVAALEILDDLADGDAPWGGPQAPHLTLALLGVSAALLRRLPRRDAERLQERWGVLATRCAAAQALDVECAAAPALSVAQALRVAEGSGLVTQWAVEAGALLAGARPALLDPLAEAGRRLGTSEKLLHDLHDLWPGPRRARDLQRPTCNLALTLARDTPDVGAAPGSMGEAAHRHHLLASGVLHYAWACADAYRAQAVLALERFAAAGGDPLPLTGLVTPLTRGGPGPSAVIEAEDAQP